jgi:metal-responsive CopG/Arc/MetJ family transcriptional regulator
VAKTKISVTVDEALVHECDRVSRGGNRSEVVERALAAWLRERRRHRLEEEIESYYSSMSARESEEDARWADRAGGALRDLWK